MRDAEEMKEAQAAKRSEAAKRAAATRRAKAEGKNLASPPFEPQYKAAETGRTGAADPNTSNPPRPGFVQDDHEQTRALLDKIAGLLGLSVEDLRAQRDEDYETILQRIRGASPPPMASAKSDPNNEAQLALALCGLIEMVRADSGASVELKAAAEVGFAAAEAVCRKIGEHSLQPQTTILNLRAFETDQNLRRRRAAARKRRD